MNGVADTAWKITEHCESTCSGSADSPPSHAGSHADMGAGLVVAKISNVLRI